MKQPSPSCPYYMSSHLYSMANTDRTIGQPVVRTEHSKPTTGSWRSRQQHIKQNLAKHIEYAYRIDCILIPNATCLMPFSPAQVTGIKAAEPSVVYTGSTLTVKPIHVCRYK